MGIEIIRDILHLVGQDSENTQNRTEEEEFKMVFLISVLLFGEDESMNLK